MKTIIIIELVNHSMLHDCDFVQVLEVLDIHVEFFQILTKREILNIKSVDRTSFTLY